MRRILYIINIAAIFSISVNKSVAQDSANANNKWHYLLQPYVMFPNMNGPVGLAELPDTKVNSNPGDVFSHLQIGAMLYFEAHNAHWAVTSDVLYMDLKQDVKSDIIIKGGEVDAKQFAWELAGLRKVSSWFEVGAGARINSLTAGLNINIISGQQETVNKAKSVTKTWVDPIIITRIKTPAKGKFSGQLRADIGGFGIGSKFSWQLQVDGTYHCSPLFDIGLGYRVINVNYEKGAGQDRFLYKMNTFGPVIRFGFNL